MYTLYNKLNNKKLIHPYYGEWITDDYDEAVDMLNACKEYLLAIGASDYINNFIIIDSDDNTHR